MARHSHVTPATKAVASSMAHSPAKDNAKPAPKPAPTTNGRHAPTPPKPSRLSAIYWTMTATAKSTNQGTASQNPTAKNARQIATVDQAGIAKTTQPLFPTTSTATLPVVTISSKQKPTSAGAPKYQAAKSNVFRSPIAGKKESATADAHSYATAEIHAHARKRQTNAHVASTVMEAGATSPKRPDLIFLHFF